MRDEWIWVALTASFAAFVAVHVVLSGRLATQKPRIRALVALVVPPLAPYWAWSAGWKGWAKAWVAGLSLYVVALVSALR